MVSGCAFGLVEEMSQPHIAPAAENSTEKRAGRLYTWLKTHLPSILLAKIFS